MVVAEELEEELLEDDSDDFEDEDSDDFEDEVPTDDSELDADSGRWSPTGSRCGRSRCP